MPTFAAQSVLPFGALIARLSGYFKPLIGKGVVSRSYPMGRLFTLSDRYVSITEQASEAGLFCVTVHSARGTAREIIESVPLDEIARRLGATASRSTHVPIVLSVPEQAIIVQQLKLPTLARSNPTEAVRFGLLRWTPFRPEEVVLAASVKHGLGDNLILAEVRYGFLPTLQQLLSQLEVVGLYPDFLSLGSGGAWIVSRHTKKLRRLGLQLKFDLFGFGLAAALITAALAVFSVRQTSTIEHLQSEVRLSMQDLQKQFQIQQKIAELEKARTFIADRQLEKVRPSSILAEITESLAGDAWIDSFQYSGRQGRVLIARSATSISSSTPISGRILNNLNMQSTQNIDKKSVVTFIYNYKDGQFP